MASPALALSASPKKNYFRSPACLATHLIRKLTPIELNVLMCVLADTQTYHDCPQWAGPVFDHKTQRHVSLVVRYAWQCNKTADAIGKALKKLEDKNLLEFRMNPIDKRVKDYRVILSNLYQFATAGEERKARTVRKGPKMSATLQSANAVENVTAIDRREEREHISTPVQSIQQHDSKIAVVESGHLETKKPEMPPTEAPPDSISNHIKELNSSETELERFLTLNVTPRLLESPDLPTISRAVRILESVNAPVEALKTKVMQRIHVFKRWGLLVNLAEDVREAYGAINRHRNVDSRVIYRMEYHWQSSNEIRGLYASADTPNEIREEIEQMWPELKATGKTKTELMYERILEKRRKKEELRKNG